MKEILANKLKVGDVYYYKDSYQVVIYTSRTSIRVKLIVGPSDSGIGMKGWYYLAPYVKVKLLCRDGKEVV